ncbi:hypothetical protein PsorP6_011566 [Peronosclerospora sorghi]|uniref:Uncharacterized protein n=1 Tax=Peronosclerospora sorghi TaxID=230839 RepID=A0ACC0WLB7_9STRA|nr:hypothetical protein PsorP6_011566 [Peronosclerospora sorghi]
MQAREVFDALYRVEPHRMEGLDVYSTTLCHLQKDVELSYVRINLPLDSQHEASRRQTRVTGGCLLEMKQSLCLAHVRGVGKVGVRAASPLRKTVVLCRRRRGQFELADYVQEREVLDASYRVEPHRLEGIDVYSTMLWHIKKDVELSYVRINQPLDSQHEASRRQTRVTGGCLLEMKQSLCLAHVVKYVTFSAEAKILVSDNRNNSIPHSMRHLFRLSDTSVFASALKVTYLTTCAKHKLCFISKRHPPPPIDHDTVVTKEMNSVVKQMIFQSDDVEISDIEHDTAIGHGLALLLDQSVVFLKLLEGSGGDCGHIFDEY